MRAPAVFGCRRFRSLLTTKPASENSDSTATVVAGTARYFRAVVYMCGNSSLWRFHLGREGRCILLPQSDRRSGNNKQARLSCPMEGYNHAIGFVSTGSSGSAMYCATSYSTASSIACHLLSDVHASTMALTLLYYLLGDFLGRFFPTGCSGDHRCSQHGAHQVTGVCLRLLRWSGLCLLLCLLLGGYC